jgi:hypothetical protein
MSGIFGMAYTSVTTGMASSGLSIGKIGMIAACGGVIYALFLGLGVLYAVAFSSAECGKQDWLSALKEAAWWGIYPVVTWILISVPYIRIQFDKFFMMFGVSKETSIWVSFGYALMLGALAGMINLRSGAIADACVPTLSEANAVVNATVEHQRQQNNAIAAATETTPAVTAV